MFHQWLGVITSYSIHYTKLYDFKQGLSRNRNVFLISLDENGVMDYEKIIDQQEARLPFMVSMPLKDAQENKMLFYAKRGGKKQLVKVDFN